MFKKLFLLTTLAIISFVSGSQAQVYTKDSSPEQKTVLTPLNNFTLPGNVLNPTKAPCTATTCATPIPVTLTTLGTQVCATACNDASQVAGPDFVGNNCYDFPNPTIWFAVTTPAATALLNITVSSATVTQPYYAIFGTTDCSLFTIYDDANECYQGTGGTVTGSTSVPQSTTLLIAVSAPAGQTGTFNVCITPQPNNSACNVSNTLSVTSTSMGSPLAGPYQVGEVVNFCYTINTYEQDGCNWLQGIVPTFGDCWDPSSFTAQGEPTTVTVPLQTEGSFYATTGSWDWWPSGSVLYNNLANPNYPVGTNVGAGWFFSSPTGTDPDNSWGDGNGMGVMGSCEGALSGLSWQVCFSLTVTANCATNPDCSVTIKTFGDGEIGNWTQAGCVADLPTVHTATLVCCLLTVNAGTDRTICANGSTALSGSYANNNGATTVSWTASVPGGTFSPSATVTNPTYSPPSGYSGTITLTMAATDQDCTIQDQLLLTVNPLNTIAAGTSQTVCVNSPITTINLATTGATGATFSGLPAGVTGSWAGNVATISGTPTAAGTFNYTVTTTGGCPPATATGTITVNPLNTIAPGINRIICINSPITTINLATTGATGATFSGLPAGVTGSWVGNVATISGTPTSAGTFNYTVTTTGGCPPATATGTITVTPLNTIAPGTSQTVCLNSPITAINLATTGATGATFTGLPAGLTGSWAGNVAAISGTPTVAGTFNYTVTTTGGCPPATTTGTITVTPLNTIAPGTSQTVCINSPITTINLATTGATGATFSGLPAGVTGSWAGNVATISGTPTSAGTFNYTVTTTGGCPPATATGTITVNPLNTIAPGTNQTVCLNSPITSINLATTGATGATFSGLPAGVTGSWAANVATISGTPTVAGTFNYTVTTTGGCPPATTTGVITVTPLNTIAAGTSQTVCLNSPITTINLATTGATGATFSGLPAGVSGSWAGNVATISGTPTAAGTFNYTVTTTGGCPPATATGTITVTPLNTIAPGTNQTVCINSAITTINLATTGATGATFSGLPAGVTGTWAGNIATISGTPTVAGTFNYTVTTTGGCPPATTTGTITVSPLNTIAAGTSQTVCVNSAITTINLATTGATGATFSGLPAGVTGSWAGNVATISGTPTVAGTFNYTVTTTGGCPPATATGTITVTPLNTITAGSNQTVCINSALTNITMTTTGATGATFSGLPAGVSGSWAGGTATIFGTPTAAGTFNYTVTTTGGCPPATTTGTITVVALPVITLTPTDPTVCNGTNGSISVSGSGTGTIFWTGTASGSQAVAAFPATISGLGAGSYNVYFVNSTGCQSTTVITSLNNPGAPVINPISNVNNCGTSYTLPAISGSSLVAPAYYTAPAGGGSVVPVGTTYNATTNITLYAYDQNGSCSSQQSFTIVINPLPAVTSVTGGATYCTGDPVSPILVAVSGTPNYTLSYTLNGVAQVPIVSASSPISLGSAAGTYVVTNISDANCTNSAIGTQTITINPTNTIAPGTNQTVCINTAITTINLATTSATGATFSGLPAGLTGSWAGNVATISGTPTAAGTFNYTVTTTGGCPPATTSGTITVNPGNTIAAGTSQTVCVNSAITTINLATTGATGATFSGLPAGVTGTWAGNVATISGTPTASGTFNYTVTTTGGCPPATATGTITVNATNTIAAGTNQTVCLNSPITAINLATTGATGATFSGLPAGVTGSWAGNVATISGTPTASGTFSYTVTTTGGCPPATTSGIITVTPLNTIASGTSETVCINSAITTINLATTGATGATFSGLPAGVTGSWAGNVATISGTPTVAGTFNYTVTTTGGCPPATATGTITVTPLNTIAAGTNQTVCMNSALTAINLATTGATGATFSGLPSGVNGSWAGNVATISGTPTSSGTFNYTVSTTGGCLPASTTGTITVNPMNTIAAGTSQTVCVNSAITSINLATTGATGATFTGLPAGVTGSWAGNVATISGTPTVAGTFNYTVTTAGGCPPATASGTITVNALPSVTAVTGGATYCAGDPVSDISVTATGTPTFTINYTLNGVAQAPIASASSPISLGTATGIYVVTNITDANCANTASGTQTITVNPLPTVTSVTGGGVYCAGSPIAPINVAVTGSPNWSISYTLDGVAQAPITGSSSPVSLGNAAGAYVVTSVSDANCTNTASGFQTITVNPLPTVTTVSGGATYCAGSTVSPINVDVTGSPIWTLDYTLNGVPQTAVTSATSPISLGNAPGTYVVTNIADANCSNTASGTQTITVNPIPSFSVSGTDPSLCNASDGSITISGLSSSVSYSVSYSDDGSTVGAANYTSTAGGTITITGLNAGSYTNFSVTLVSSGCTGTNGSVVILNNPGAPIITDLADQTVCDTYILPAITGTGLTGSEGYFTAPNGGGTALAVGSTVTTTQTIYIYDINGTCADEETVLITVNNTPAINPIADATACASYSLPVITGTNLTGSEAFYNNSQALGGTLITGPITSTQTVWVYDAEWTCSDETSFLVTINPLPTVTAVTGGGTYCAGDVVNDVVAAVTGTGAWTVDYTLNGTAMTANGATSPVILGNSAGVYVVTNVTDANCTNTTNGTQTIVINPIPAAPTAGADSLYCSSWSLTDMTVTGTGGTYTWYSNGQLTLVLGTGNTLMPIDVNGTNYYYVTETLNGCEGPADSVTITIQDCEIIVPTAFTPNGDGVHDTWEIIDLDDVYPNNVVTVYNRWGNMIYQSEEGQYSAKPWDGTYEGDALPVASYYFVIDFNDDKNESQTGIVSIILVK